MPTINTVFSPAVFPLYTSDLEKKNVVVIDVLRATTTICKALYNGASSVLPVKSPEECITYQTKGYLCAAERGGYKVEGFDFGNSPQEFTPENVNGKNIALTTTNGTRALLDSKEAKNVFAGSFLNLSLLSGELVELGNDVILFCAGWKDKFNLEDTLFAGAVIERIKPFFEIEDDGSKAALDLWLLAKQDPHSYLQKANHVNRFKEMHAESDLEACLNMDKCPVLPVFKNGVISLFSKTIP